MFVFCFFFLLHITICKVYTWEKCKNSCLHPNEVRRKPQLREGESHGRQQGTDQKTGLLQSGCVIQAVNIGGFPPPSIIITIHILISSFLHSLTIPGFLLLFVTPIMNSSFHNWRGGGEGNCIVTILQVAGNVLKLFSLHSCPCP